MTNVLQTAMSQTIEGMQPKQVYGEPIERDGAIYLRPPRCAAAEAVVATPRATAAPDSA